MSILTLLIIAAGLAMDAFSVSIASGAVSKHMRLQHAFRMAFLFGLFQFLMPIVGWLAGTSFRQHVQAVDHWIAFGLLSIIGIKMIYESFQLKHVEEKDPMHWGILLTLAVATSIDALAVGITLSILGENVWLAVTIIGLVTFVMCLLGAYLGKHFGHLFENRIEIIAGLILIGIGIKILIDAQIF